MKKILSLVMVLVITLVLTSCWAGEISVETKFAANGSGTRTIILDVMDDTLASEPIPNPEDPEGTKGKGPVINNQHITGGLLEIQTWLKANAPEFITVKDPQVDGYHRYFIMEYSFSDFDDFIAKYKALIELSPTITWDDFDKDQLPTFTSKGFFSKEVVFTESKEMLVATLDWAISGIWEDIYDDQGLGAWGLEKGNIYALAEYKVTIGNEKYELTSGYDADAPDGEEGNKGKIVYFAEEDLKATGKVANVTSFVLVGVAAVAVIGVAVLVPFLLKKKK